MTEAVTGPKAARAYLDLGLRVVPIKADTKRPAAKGFDDPAWTAQPKEFKHHDQIGILCGALLDPPDDLSDRVGLLCIDLDGALDTRGLCAALGVMLPDTLATHRCKHLWYWVRPGELADQLKQWAGILGVRRSWTGEGKAPDADLKWHGGYAVERGAPSEFDTSQIALLPDECLRALLDAPGVPKHDPSVEPTELPEPRLLEQAEADAILEAVVEEWPDAGQGRHDCALAFGGALRRIGASREDAEALASALVEATGSDAGRVNDALDAWDRTDEGRPAYGRATLETLLLGGGPKTLEALDGAARLPEWMQAIARELEDAPLRPLPGAGPGARPVRGSAAAATAEAALGCLPEWVREHALAVREELRTPLDLNVANALGAISAAISGRVKVRITSNYTCHTCLFVCAVADSSERKSPAFNRATAPINAWAQERVESEKDDLLRALTRRTMAENRRKSLQTTLAKQLGPDADATQTEEHEELIKLTLELDAPPPVPFEFLVEDATPEALADLLAIHGRLACFSSDASKVFQVLSGRYSDGQSDLGVWLEAYDGRPRKVHRIGRKAEAPRHAQTTLAAVLSVQPSVLENVTGNSALVGEGLLPRFCWVVCPPAVVRYAGVDDVPTPAPESVTSAWDAGVRALLTLPAGLEAKLSAEALALHQAFGYELELRMRAEGGDLGGDMRSWAGKHLERCVRIAALLWATEGAEGELSGDQMARAITIGRWLIPHAVAALRGADLDGLEAKVVDVVERLTKSTGAPVTKRQIQRGAPRSLRGDSKALALRLENLVERGALVLSAKGYSIP